MIKLSINIFKKPINNPKLSIYKHSSRMRTVRLQVPSDDYQMSVAGGLGPGLGESYVWWPEGGGTGATSFTYI